MAIVELETGEKLEFDNKYSDEQISQAVEEYLSQKSTQAQQPQGIFQPKRDINLVKRNISKMIEQSAPESDIDEYVTSEGYTPEMLRGEQLTQTQQHQENFQPKTALQQDIVIWTILVISILVISIGFLAIKFIYNKDKVYSCFLKLINKFINFISIYTPILDIWNKSIKSSKYFLHYFVKFLLFSIKWGIILWIGYIIIQTLKENLLILIAFLLGVIVFQLNEIKNIILTKKHKDDMDDYV